MFILSFFRIIKFSLQDISRNIWLSLVTIIILILALFSINMMVVVKVIGDTAITAVKEKVDVSLYLKSEAQKDQINNLKTRIENLDQVENVKYVSKSEALEFFKKNNNDNPEVLRALRELGKNPLTPSLIIKPQDTKTFPKLKNELNKMKSDIIESRNFADHELILNKINSITDKVSDVGLALSLIFIFTTLLVVYNAIRVAIYTHNTEISIMRLVGASNFFIYMPFILSSLIYTLIGVVLVILLFYPFLSLLQPYLEAFFVGYNVNVITYFNAHFWQIFGAEFIGIAFINIIASFIAIRKYAQV